jgi:23S rRNA (adenine(2503)-C(2))-methyltransferase
MDIGKLEKFLEENDQPKFRLEQIVKAVYQDGVFKFSEISNIPKNLREELDKKIKILSFEAEKILVSSGKSSAKALLKLKDGNFTETVLISPKPNIWSVCISCQVGCPMNCAFCATGARGFKRNLTIKEITDQVLFWKQYLAFNLSSYKEERRNNISNVVYMGMGEPFLNWENVRESLAILTDKKYFNFGSRSISVSTAGIPEGIKNLAKNFPQINLAVSLHFADDEKRNRYMPINKKYNLSELRKALEEYFSQCNRKVFLEYILFDKINDKKEDAGKLAEYVKTFRKSHLLHVNLIRYNETTNEFKTSSSESTQRFKKYLMGKDVNVSIRKSLGSDIQGACGQLAGK